MPNFRFVGTTLDIGDRRLTRLGEKITLDSDMGAPLITEEAFQSVGFTEDELKAYATPGQRAEMPSEFASKLSKAWGMIGKAPQKPLPGKPKEGE